MRDAFTALSSDALRENNQSFLALASPSLGEFQQTARVELRRPPQGDRGPRPAAQRVAQPGRRQAPAGRAEPGRHARRRSPSSSSRCTPAQQTLQAETGRLVQALRSPNVRGQWGELQLRRVVEAAGMLEYCDFDLKESVNGDGGRLTPDLIVRLPGGKNVVVDAKVPLVGLPRRDGNRRRAGSATRSCGTTRARCRDHVDQAREQDLLAALPAGAGPRDHVRAGRDAAERRAPARSGAARIQPGPRRDAGEPADADGAAARGRVRLAAGKDRARTRRRSASSGVSSTIASGSWRCTSRRSRAG